MKRTRLIVVLKALFAAALIVVLLSRIDMGDMLTLMRGVDKPLFALSFAVFAGRIVFGALRNKVLLDYEGDRFSVASLTRFYFIGFFFNMFLPTVVGGDIARGYYLYKGSGGNERVIGTVIVERILGILAMMVLSVASVLVSAAAGYDIVGNDTVRFITVSFVIGLILSCLFFNRRTERIIERMTPASVGRNAARIFNMLRGMTAYGRAPRVLAAAYVLSVAFQFLSIVSTWLIGRSLGDNTPFVYYLILLPVIWLVTMAPVSINGIGIREGAFIVLFGAVGMPQETAMAVSLLLLTQSVVIGAAGGLVFLVGNGSVGDVRNFRAATGGNAEPRNDGKPHPVDTTHMKGAE